MEDLKNRLIEPGMIMMEVGRGLKWENKKEYYSLKLWEFPVNYSGQGLEYNLDGEKHEWYWANYKSSYILDKSSLPEEFMFSFYHGMSDLYTTIKKGSIEELINNSDWEERAIFKEDIDNYCKLKDITLNNLSDIKNIIPLMEKSKYIPRKIVESTINIAGAKLHDVINGESGIAVLYDNMLFNQIIHYLKSETGDHANV